MTRRRSIAGTGCASLAERKDDLYPFSKRLPIRHGAGWERPRGDQRHVFRVVRMGGRAPRTVRGAAHFMGAGTMRLIVQPFAGRFELCARLGLLLIPAERLNSAGRGGKIVHAALDGSPGARAGIETRDIIFLIDGMPWDSVRQLTFSDRRPTEITAETFVARYFTLAKITVRVPPEPYRHIEEITAEAANIITARPTLDKTPYRNPRFDDMRELLARFSRRGRR
jgi:hypothetical protein